jgi:hypothetical protein
MFFRRDSRNHLNPWLVIIVVFLLAKNNIKLFIGRHVANEITMLHDLNPMGVVSFSGAVLAAGICDIITPTGAGEEVNNIMLAILVNSESLTLILIVISLSFFIITSRVLLL